MSPAAAAIADPPYLSSSPPPGHSPLLRLSFVVLAGGEACWCRHSNGFANSREASPTGGGARPVDFTDDETRPPLPRGRGGGGGSGREEHVTRGARAAGGRRSRVGARRLGAVEHARGPARRLHTADPRPLSSRELPFPSRARRLGRLRGRPAGSPPLRTGSAGDRLRGHAH